MTLSEQNPQDVSSGSGHGDLTVALAGNPNVGKTTLFNALTGLKQKVANYPGVTVEKKVGTCTVGGAKGLVSSKQIQIIDLPGTYSLASRSPDEHVARQVLLGQIPGTPRPDVVVVVCDASNLQRNLFLVTQMMELGRPTVVALSMTDVAEKLGRPVNVEKLAAHLRVPVVAVQAHKGLGMDALKKAILAAAGKKASRLELPLPDVMETHVERLKKILQEEELLGHQPQPGDEDQAVFDAHLMLTTSHDEEMPDTRREHPKVRAALQTALQEMAGANIDPIAAEIETHYTYITSIAHDVVVEVHPSGLGQTTTTDRIDRVLTHKIWGMGIFVLVMGLVFWSIFSWANPLMGFLQDTVVGGLGQWISHHMADGPLQDLLVSGVIAGVGNVVVFLPQIVLLFLFLAILEDSGYMSRAAFLMDRVMSRVGLHGKSFIPLLSGFACAVPAIMGTRVIENRRDRLATILILPLMSCSARLPVYLLFTALFFSKAWQGALVMLSMYLLGTLTAFALAWVFKRTLLKGPAPAFILEMPPYRLPHWKVVLTTVIQRSWAFVKRAGTIIFAFSILMWAGTHYPKPAHFSEDYDATQAPLITQKQEIQRTLSAEEQALALSSDEKDQTRIPSAQQGAAKSYAEISGKLDDLDNARSQEILEYSVAGRIGHVIAPVFYPLGYDWKASVGVAGAFFAREVIISTMGIVYSVGEADETSSALKSAMRDDLWPAGSARAGMHIWTPLTAISLMVFVVFCMQCLSTLAIVRRETGTWKWAVFMFFYMTGLAYVAALIVYQGGRLLGF